MRYRLLFFLICLVITILALFSAVIDWLFQLFFIGIAYFYTTIYILSNNNYKKNKNLNVFVLLLPFILIYGYVFINNPNTNYKVLPILIMPIFSCIFGYITFLKKNNKFYLILYSITVVITAYIGMPNWINYIADDENPINEKFPEIAIRDINDNPFSFKDNKVIVLDLWSTSCGICIKKFPDFERLKLKYKHDNKVEFYTLNLPLERDSTIDVYDYVKNYKFKSLFATNLDSWEKLDNKTVPKFLILNKSKKIVYKGFLNDKWYEFYNDIDNLIDKYRNE